VVLVAVQVQWSIAGLISTKPSLVNYMHRYRMSNKLRSILKGITASQNVIYTWVQSTVTELGAVEV
jgi:hypothetical protein